MPFKSKCRVVEKNCQKSSSGITLVIFLCNNGVNLCKVNTLHILLCTVQDDGFTAIPVFAGGCTDIVFDTVDCKVPANVPGSPSAK